MSAPPRKPSGFSLYGDLLDPSTQNATISGAPVKYEMKKAEPEVESVVKKKQDASLKFQPVKRPQVQQQKPKPKNWSSSSSGHKFSSSTVSVPGGQPEVTPQQQSNLAEQPRSTFQDWVGDEDEEDFFFDNRHKHQRGGKKHKNKKGRAQEEKEVDWDAIYDPSKPTILARYQGSTEQEAERREWKEFLYYHASKNKSRLDKPKPKNTMFAPPSGLSFAPPALDTKPSAPDPMDLDDDSNYQPPPATSDQAVPAFDRSAVAFAAASADMSTDISGEDAYARRMRLSGMATNDNASSSVFVPTAPTVPTTPTFPSPPAPAPVPAAEVPAGLASTLAAAHAKLAAAKAKIDAARAQSASTAPGPSPAPQVNTSAPSPPPPPPPPEEEDGTSISRAPVRYNLADAQVDASLGRESGSALSPATDQPRSKAPGQKGFGARMMAKMGWEKGQGLGAKGEGITTALVAQAEKRKKRADKDGGGWAQPRNMGKIVGGKKRKVESTADDDGQFGIMSYVVKLSGMLSGLDITYEIEENNLLQEIGEEFGGKYGPIERLFIWRDQNGGNNDVFVRFNSQLGALRAVNGTDGMTFAENPVVARFFSTEKFEEGEYA